ncbi:aquaporin-5-like isoform X2 [Convolutriloba macropyga]|uniref:aquaporin-5-like isoform X2 n=1 Tax=Convolutriloba macropyga TaxID=536237 RepID=UPI003F5276EF
MEYLQADCSKSSSNSEIPSVIIRQLRQKELVDEPSDSRMKLLGRTFVVGLDEIKTLDFWRAVFGEFLATFFFLLTCLIGIWSSGDSVASVIAGALGTGLAIALLVQMFNAISGGNINPAVSLALLVNGQISVLKCVMYIIAQMAGAVAGSGIVKLTTLESPDSLAANGEDSEALFSRCIPKIIDGYEWEGILLEFLFTSMLIMQVLRCTDSERPVQNGNIALSVGLVVVIANLCLIPITGGPVNPARYGGPAIVGTHWDDFGFYMLGQFGASIVTPFVYSPLLTKIKSDVAPPQSYTLSQKP